MKKAFLIFAAVSTIVFLSAQELQHDAVAINVEVPVRVFRGNRFLDHLTIDDFEVFEDGAVQKIEAVYLVKKTEITREDTAMQKEEAQNKFAPQIARNFVLIFEVTDYLPKIKEAIAFFLKM